MKQTVKSYMVIELTFKDRSWVGEYLPNATRLARKHGGTFLSRTATLEKLEGDRALPHVLVILEFPSKEAAHAFLDDPEYAPFREARQAGSTSEMILAPGEDIGAGPPGG